MPVWFGIDPGVKGAIAMVDEAGRADALPMPIEGKFLNIRELRKWMTARTHPTNIRGIAIEHVHAIPGVGGRGISTAAMFNFGRGFGQLVGMCEALDWPHALVNSRAWKAAVLKGTPQDKAAAVLYAGRSYPLLDLKRSRQARKPDDGICDAVCIADWCRLWSQFRQ